MPVLQQAVNTLYTCNCYYIIFIIMLPDDGPMYANILQFSQDALYNSRSIHGQYRKGLFSRSIVAMNIPKQTV